MSIAGGQGAMYLRKICPLLGQKPVFTVTSPELRGSGHLAT